MSANWLDADDRPWGRWEEYLNEPGYRVKRITVEPGRRLSLQKHRFRSEFWVVVAGSGRLLIADREIDVHVGDTAHIPVEVVHRIENVGDAPLVIVETQIGRCDEDDIIRLEDDFGRA